jgi:glycerol-3-phosphate O-acyltransferase
MKKKAELKEITLKSKLAKTVPKQDLAKQYDEYVENKVKEKTKKEEVKKEVVSDSEVIVKKPKPKKKIVYVSESESEEEEVIVKKKTKVKAQPQPLEHLVYNNTKDQLYNRMIEERVRNSIIGYGNALGV